MSNISLCMIVKNEDSGLDKCLKSIVNYVDEIIIVDTGSSDRTKEIASSYTDKIYDFIWVNDFAAARNYSICKATNEFILVLDGDEFIESIDIEQIRGLLDTRQQKIGRIQRINEFTRKGNSYRYYEKVNRLFSKKYFHYEGIIHEQLTFIEKHDENLQQQKYDLDNRTFNIPITVMHTGYEGDLINRKKKTQRNIALLEKALVQTPKDPYLLYQLGKSYYMEEDYKKACDYLGQALDFNLDLNLEYVQDLVESFGYALLNTNQFEKSLQLLNIYDELMHSADFLFLVGLILMNNSQFGEAIRAFHNAINTEYYKMEGTNSFLAYYNIGVIYECLGDNQKAIKYYLECGPYKSAKERLDLLMKI